MIARTLRLLGIACWPYAALATQDQVLEPASMEFDALYRIEPALVEQLPCEAHKSCEPPVFEGLANVRATVRPADGSLSAFEVRVGERNVAADLARKYRDRRGFSIRSITLTQSPGYLPAQLRGNVIGLGRPYIAMLRLTFDDATCKSERREIYMLYEFETDHTELSDACADE